MLEWVGSQDGCLPFPLQEIGLLLLLSPSLEQEDIFRSLFLSLFGAQAWTVKDRMKWPKRSLALMLKDRKKKDALHKEARGYCFLWFCCSFVWFFREHLVATRSRKCTKKTGWSCFRLLEGKESLTETCLAGLSMNLLAGQSFQKQQDLESLGCLEPVGHEGNSPALILWQVYLRRLLRVPWTARR